MMGLRCQADAALPDFDLPSPEGNFCIASGKGLATLASGLIESLVPARSTAGGRLVAALLREARIQESGFPWKDFSLRSDCKQVHFRRLGDSPGELEGGGPSGVPFCLQELSTRLGYWQIGKAAHLPVSPNCWRTLSELRNDSGLSLRARRVKVPSRVAESAECGGDEPQLAGGAFSWTRLLAFSCQRVPERHRCCR